MNNERIYYSHEAQLRVMRSIAGLVLFSLAVGLAIGATIATILSRSSAKQLRANFVKVVEEGLSRGRAGVKPALERLDEEFSELRTNVSEHFPHVKEAAAKKD